MENPLLNTISNSNISKNVNIKNNLSQTNTQLFNVSANLMPTERQTTIGVTNPSAVTKSNNEMKRFTSKEYFILMEHHHSYFRKFSISKALSTPMYTHNIAQTKYAHISSWITEEPRFTKKISILA